MKIKNKTYRIGSIFRNAMGNYVIILFVKENKLYVFNFQTKEMANFPNLSDFASIKCKLIVY